MELFSTLLPSTHNTFHLCTISARLISKSSVLSNTAIYLWELLRRTCSFTSAPIMGSSSGESAATPPVQLLQERVGSDSLDCGQPREVVIAAVFTKYNVSYKYLRNLSILFSFPQPAVSAAASLYQSYSTSTATRRYNLRLLQAGPLQLPPALPPGDP